MKYLIILKNNTCFYTSWYDYENNYNPEIMFMVINLAIGMYTTDGETWIEMEVDNL